MPCVAAWLGDVASSPEVGGITSALEASRKGTKKLNSSVASSAPEVPVTEAKRRVSVPPGVVVDGVETLVTTGEPTAEALVTARNCRLPGSASVMSRSVTVCPLATSTVIRYWRGKFGPVAVSSSGPI